MYWKWRALRTGDEKYNKAVRFWAKIFGLSAREVDILRLIAAGNSNKLIASHLSVTEDTVKAHVKNILSKLGANDRTHAVTIGLKRGIIRL